MQEHEIAMNWVLNYMTGCYATQCVDISTLHLHFSITACQALSREHECQTKLVVRFDDLGA